MNNHKFYILLVLIALSFIFLSSPAQARHWRQDDDPKWFESVEQAQDWMNIHRVYMANGRNGICEEYAERAMIEAYQDGYLLPMCPVWRNRVFGGKVSDFQEPHVGNWIRVDNYFYYIEPQYLPDEDDYVVRMRIKAN